MTCLNLNYPAFYRIYFLPQIIIGIPMSIAETDAQIINPDMPDVPPHAPSKINLKDYQKPWRLLMHLMRLF